MYNDPVMQTLEAVKKIRGQTAAEEEHKRMGRVVRRTIQKELGVSPEDLRAEPPIKELSSRTKRQLRDSGPPPTNA